MRYAGESENGHYTLYHAAGDLLPAAIEPMTILQALQIALEHQRAGRLPQAEAMYRQILATVPDEVNALHGLAYLALGARQSDDAERLIRRAIAIDPQSAPLQRALADILYPQGRSAETIAALERSIELQPTDASAYLNLAVLFCDQGRPKEAVDVCRRCIAINPNVVSAYTQAASILLMTGCPQDAGEFSRRAMELDPENFAANNNFGEAMRQLGRITEARPYLEKAFALSPQNPAAASNFLLSLQYDHALTPEQIAQRHFTWGALVASRTPVFESHSNVRDPARRLRIGYVSPDFRMHAVSTFFLPILLHRDRARFEVYAYANSRIEDPVTVQLRAACDRWRSIAGMSDEQVAQFIAGDAIDILVDLTGHMGDNRLPLFARKPAPIQITYLGYPGTTGLKAMDYRLTDMLADPVGMTESLHTEELLRLPRTAWSYTEPRDAPPVSNPPVLQSTHITFGSFNALAKLTSEGVGLWSNLLHQTPGSKLLIKARAFSSDDGVARIRKQFAAHQIPANRLILLPHVRPQREHLSDYARVDIALDTFPYHGTTTTCEALWMGVPAITLAGRAHVSRVGVSLLTSVGLSDLIAHSPEQYVQKAAALAADVERLQRIRKTMRQTMRTSSLMDGRAMAADVEAAYRQVWRRWCES